jgi:hypothetical protein
VKDANNGLENTNQTFHERPASQEEIEITENLLEYFRILIEFDERDKSLKRKLDNPDVQ